MLGQELLKLLVADKKVNVLATARGKNRNNLKEGYNYQAISIDDFADLQEVFDRFEPDVVINCAAMTNVDACETDHAACDAANVQGVFNLASLCLAFEAKLIHISTDFIFDGTEGPYAEDAEANPVSYYGRSKMIGEEIVKNAGIEFAIARTVLVYGAKPGGTRSDIVLWAKGALAKGEPIRVVNDQFRSPTLVQDLAIGVKAILDKNASGIYHLSGPDQLSIVEIVKTVGEVYGLSTENLSEISSESLNQAAKRPPVTGFILDKAKKDLDYDPRSLVEGLKFLENL